MLTQFPEEELLAIANSLEDYHKVFYTFFDMSSVMYCDDSYVPTACVRFHPESGRKPDLIINKGFWESKTHREKLWIICHECLHIILLHDERMGSEVPGATAMDVNRAQDITINEMFVKLFGFDRREIRDWKNYCWIDTCFLYPQLVKQNETFTYYLDLLVKEQKKDQPQLLDVHGIGTPMQGSAGDPQQGDQDGHGSQENREKMAGRLAEDLTAEELETLIGSFPESKMAGMAAGMYDMIIGEKRRSSKVNFKKMIKHLKRTRVKMVEKDAESFVLEDRRFADVIKRSNVTLPGKHQVEKPSKDRLLTALFMDVSGSCITYLSTFNKVFTAFDAEKDFFEIRTFTFDVRVIEVEPFSNVRVGGGTNFQIIEDKVQELKNEYGKYPDCVIVISDGEGPSFTTEAPSRWVWLLTPHSTTQYIPTTSKKYNISDVIF